MQTVTQLFKDAQAAGRFNPVREVYYKRRYWSQTLRAYTWEANWTRLYESEVVSMAQVTGNLDTERLNEFKISNLTIILKNVMNVWGQKNPFGKFGQSASYPLGFERHWTKFQIKTGYILSDGTTETIPLFVGLATEWMTDSESHEMQVTVQGLEALLIAANGENVSTLITEENMGTGNGSNKDFTTVQPGVGIIDYVSLAGITKKAGTDYTVSQQNDRTLGAKISFTVAPAVGVVVRITYRYWKQNQQVENLVKDLLTEAGIPGASQIVDPVLFPNQVGAVATQDSQTDWLAGTLTRTDATRVPGDVRLDFNDTNHMELFEDFTDGNYTSNPVWTNQFDPIAVWTVASGRVARNQSGQSHLIADCTRFTGVWQVDMRWDTIFSGGSMNIWFITDAWNPSNIDPSLGYGIIWTGSTFKLVKKSGAGQTTLASTTKAQDTSNHTVRISRSPDGRFKVYWDSVLTLEATDLDASITRSTKIGIGSDSSSGQPASFDNIYVPKATLTGTFRTQAMDLSAGVSSIGQAAITESLSGGTITYYSLTSADNITYDSRVALPANKQINSTVRRYLKIEGDWSVPSDGSDPALNSLEVPYKTSQTTVALANFTDKTVYQAIQDLGKFANYEWGFRADETFFFRSKIATEDIDILLARDTNISTIMAFDSGVGRVYHEVVADYGSFSATVSDDGLFPGSPRARFGKRRLSLDGGGILVSNDVDIATGIASLYYGEVSKPRSRFKVRAKYLPQVELSDTAEVNFPTNLPVKQWHLGDTGVYLGQKDIYLYGDGEQLVANKLAKVIGLRHDTENWISEFDMEEILT